MVVGVMSAVEVAKDLQNPLYYVVSDDFEEVIKRIERVEFYDDHVCIRLIADNPSVKLSVFLLNLKLIVKAPLGVETIWPIDLGEEWTSQTGLVDCEAEASTIQILFPGIKKLIFSDDESARAFEPKT